MTPKRDDKIHFCLPFFVFSKIRRSNHWRRDKRPENEINAHKHTYKLTTRQTTENYFTIPSSIVVSRWWISKIRHSCFSLLKKKKRKNFTSFSCCEWERKREKKKNSRLSVDAVVRCPFIHVLARAHTHSCLRTGKMWSARYALLFSHEFFIYLLFLSLCSPVDFIAMNDFIFASFVCRCSVIICVLATRNVQ